MSVMRLRWILHADMDAFYASIEQRDNPSLKGQPVIVGGTGSRGVVSTASYEARKYGVKSAMPIVEARRRCPEGIFMPPDIAKYAKVSEALISIFEKFSPIVEPLSLDEAFLDISGMHRLYSDIAEIGQKLKAEVEQNLSLTVSVGIAPNKFLAKLASDLQKPDGLVIVRPGEELALLAPLPIRKLWGVGEAAAKILERLSIATIADLRQANSAVLERALGRSAVELQNLASGRDERPVVPDREAKSIGNEDTFAEDIADNGALQIKLLSLAARLGRRLRKAGLAGRTVTLKVRFASFRTITRSITLTEPVHLDDVIYKTALAMFDKITITEGVRLLGITVSNLNHGLNQLSLFANLNNENAKQEKVAETMDKLRDRFGKNIITRGSLIEKHPGKPK